ncbi:phytanoyl-CoA dioxygenase domain-containing protein 1-like [Babylonia areolata]|uniref:phytanoyl-CoA dioxygenase domain-containing protein 1-like n=1 Tax=Babylonia areolata TaxID=304850 RepID=UPI003FD0C895
MSVDRKDIAEFFDKNGYISPLDVLSTKEAKQLRENFNRCEEETGQEDATYSLHNVHMTKPWVLRLATHNSLLAPLQKILGPNLILLDSRFICKYPTPSNKDAFVAWHQDVRYWGVEGDVVSVWLAVDDADVENACMHVIPGSHKQGVLNHVSADKGGNLLTSNQSIPLELFDVKKSVPCPLKAGQMSLHHGHIVHGSETNHSTRRRCGYVIRYIATTTRPIADPDRPRTFPATVLVSGKNEEGYFQDHAPEWFTWRQ